VVNAFPGKEPDVSTPTGLAADHHVRNDFVRSTPKRVLVVVANPATATTTGWPVGFWAEELTHPYYELTERGIDVTIASPDGGRVVFDQLSDPRDPSKWSANDLISMGFVNTPELMGLLDDTPKLSELDVADFDALMIAGGLSPMWTFRENETLKSTIAGFYEAEKPVAVYCHGTAGLVDVTLSDGSYLVTGKTLTGFSNVEEEYSDAFVGQTIMPWRIEDAMKERGANYVQGGLFKAFVVRDGRLITGQQQYSSRKVAQALIDMLGV
jgi:putative intracellular protease/amidase